MNDAFKKLHGSTIAEALNGGRPTLSAKEFLGKQDGQAYFNPTTFLTYAKSLRPNEVVDLEQILTFMTEGIRFTGSLGVRKDRGGRSYVYITGNRSNSSSGGKLIIEPGTTKFLNDYVNYKFVVGFTLEEVIEEAMND